MDSIAAVIDEGLERIEAHSSTLKSAKERVLDDSALAELVAGSLRYHREERARWRKAVQLLPAHLKEQVLSDDLGGMVESSVNISHTSPTTPQQAVRLPPPDPGALKMLTPTASAAAVELRKSRAEGANVPADQVTPEASVSVRAGFGGHGNPLVVPSRDPLRSARASPAQLPQGGLSELEKVLARRRGEEQ